MAEEEAQPTNPLGLSEEELRGALAEMKSHLAAGKSDEETCLLMGITWENYDALKRVFYNFESARAKKSTEEVFVDYVLHQRAVIKDLSDAYEKFKGSNQSNAMVGALRARADVYDKIIKVGQEFGLIEKKPEERRILAGIAVAEISDDKLRSMIVGEISNVDRLMKAFGNTSMAEVVVEETHYELPPAKDITPKKKEQKTNRAKANKVHKGRRVVKGGAE
jgi:hypothetical protein